MFDEIRAWTAILGLVATGACGLFAGAALYINLVEHPARMSGGVELALREWAPNYTRAAVMQASLAGLGSVAGMLAWARGDGLGYLGGALTARSATRTSFWTGGAPSTLCEARSAWPPSC